MVGFSDKHNGIGCFRVDRISEQPTILPVDAVSIPDDFDLNEYINTSFRMFNSEHSKVELVCDNSVMDSIIDRFGNDVQTFANDMTSFRAVVNIAVSHVFLSWGFGFGGKVEIKSPQDVKLRYDNMVRSAYEKIENQ